MKRVSLLVALAWILAAGPLLAATTIIINTTTDATTSEYHTCSYTGAGRFPAGDGLCTFRRAIVEASWRPQSDRPITIRFTGIDPYTDPHYDPVTEVATLPITAALPALKTDTILDLNGQVTIQGPPLTADGRPRVMIDTDWSFEIESENNLLTRIGFHGGGGISIKEDGNTLDKVFLGLRTDGLELEPADPGNLTQLAGSGIHIGLGADNNTIQESVISGTIGKAIDINAGTSNNVVQNSYIGTRFDGTVRAVAPEIECARSLVSDPANWYGGWGVAIAGTGHTITGNTIAGLHIPQSANDTPPRAIEILGADHLISNNVIGRDSSGANVGVCGQGIKVAGSGTRIIANTIVRSRLDSEGAVATAMLANDGSPSFGEIAVQENVVIDGPGTTFEYGPAVAATLRLYEPGEITGITGLVVSGEAPVGSPCDGCRIDFYRDDDDGDEEALEYLGYTLADPVTGDFSFTLPDSFPAGDGIRTMSTSELSGVIGSYGAGTTTKASSTLYIPDLSIFADGFEGGNTSSWSSVVQ